MNPTAHQIDLGHHHTFTFHSWKPARQLNPQYDALPDVERYGAIVRHLRPDGRHCTGGAITFVRPVSRTLNPHGHFWQVESWEPLTLSPSLHYPLCGDHGFIRERKWVPV